MNYFTSEKYDHIRKRILDSGNDCIREIEKVLDIFSESISNALKNGNAVEIRGLGRWYCKILKENFNLRNPATNELIYKPVRVKVRFKPSKNLKKIINE